MRGTQNGSKITIYLEVNPSSYSAGLVFTIFALDLTLVCTFFTIFALSKFGANQIFRAVLRNNLGLYCENVSLFQVQISLIRP